MTDYFYVSETNCLGDKNDPARKFAEKYSNGTFRIFFGKGKAAILVKASAKPETLEATPVATAEEIKDKELLEVGFSASELTVVFKEK